MTGTINIADNIVILDHIAAPHLYESDEYVSGIPHLINDAIINPQNKIVDINFSHNILSSSF